MPLISQTELAAHLGLSTRQVRNLEAQGVLRAELNASGKKAYPWPESNHRYWQSKLEEAKGARTSTEASIEDATLRKALADAEAAELRVAELKRELIHVRDVEALVAEPLEAVGSLVRNLPNRWASVLVGCSTPQEVIARLRPVVAEMLDALREVGVEIAGERSEDSDAA